MVKGYIENLDRIKWFLGSEDKYTVIEAFGNLTVMIYKLSEDLGKEKDYKTSCKLREIYYEAQGLKMGIMKLL